MPDPRCRCGHPMSEHMVQAMECRHEGCDCPAYRRAEPTPQLDLLP